MRVNDVLPRDYNSESWKPPERIECAGYNNPRIPPDYSPRDTRVWLRACRCVGCPIERCLHMREPG